jgi:hypothetical protein
MSEDDDPEIERLRDVRAAFRAMPEEDPPERGLADLMAAARAKADEMRPVTQGMEPGDRVLAVPWWKRLGAMFRRPSVLAFATVLVFVGGAVLIGRRGDEDVARPTVEPKGSPPAATTSAAGSGAMAKEEATKEQRERGDFGKDTGGEATQTETKPEPPPPAKPSVDPRREPPKAPARLGVDSPKPDTTAKPADPAPPVGHHTTRSPTPISPPPAPTADKAKDSNDRAPDNDKPSVKPTEKVPQDELILDGETSAPPAPGATTEGRRLEGPGRKATPEQLLQQCRTAASRGDCAATKAIAARIEKDDASFYRERVVKDAGIARCLK